MTINQDYPIFDGIAPSWADVKVTAKGASTPLLDMKDIASIDTGVTLEVGEMVGASGGRVMRRTTGAAKHEAKWSLYHSGFNAILRNLGPSMLTRGNERIYGVIHFDVEYFWTPPGSAEIFQTIMLGCRMMGRTLNSAEGTDATQIEVPLNPIKIVDIVDGIRYVVL